MSTKHMAATSHPLATSSALRILERGGNAMDAALSAIAVQCVVEPAMTGIGGDAFLLYSEGGNDKIFAINGSGPAPAAATTDTFASLGVTTLEGSIHAVTVPGCVSAWEKAHKRFGRLSFADCLEDSISYARDGFPITGRVAYDWSNSVDKLNVSRAAHDIYLKDGKPYEAGDLLCMPALADSLQLISDKGAAGFYAGDMAEKMVATLNAHGGLHTLEDFAGYEAEWVEPISAPYAGYEIWECPPNGSGIVALSMLNMLTHLPISEHAANSATRMHLEVEAARLAYRDRDALLGDPAHVQIPSAQWLDPAYGKAQADLIHTDKRIDPLPTALSARAHEDTVYLCVVDQEGNAVSFINSIFDGFGSGYACAETGVLFHSRGAVFSLDAEHPNAVAPGRRPMHTIIPAMATKDGKVSHVFGVMGGHYQPAGQVHVLTRMLHDGMDPQQALDSPRIFPKADCIEIEDGFDASVGEALSALGHNVIPAETPVGGGQIIAIDPANGVLTGGTDPRKDGCALG